MKRYEEGGDIDEMEAANERTERMLMPNERGAAGTSETVFPSEKPKAKAKAKTVTKDAPKVQDNKPAAKYETSYDRMNRTNRESGTDFDSMLSKLKNRITGASDRGQDRILTGIKKKSNENKFMGSTNMKSGGSVSSASKRADGCAIRGKTRA